METFTLVQIFGVIGLVAGPLAATYISNLFQMRREREQAERESLRERRIWLRDEKKRIYLSVLSATMEMIEQKKPGEGITVNRDAMIKLGGYVQQLDVFGMEGFAKELSRDFEAMLSAMSGQPPAMDSDAFAQFNNKIMEMGRKDLGVDG